jgi:hypothetical protein
MLRAILDKASEVSGGFHFYMTERELNQAVGSLSFNEVKSIQLITRNGDSSRDVVLHLWIDRAEVVHWRIVKV